MSVSIKSVIDDREGSLVDTQCEPQPQQQEQQQQRPQPTQYHLEDHLKFPNEIFQMLLQNTTVLSSSEEPQQSQQCFDAIYNNNKQYKIGDSEGCEMKMVRQNGGEQCYVDLSNVVDQYSNDYEDGKEEEEYVTEKGNANESSGGLVLDVNYLKGMLKGVEQHRPAQYHPYHYYLPQSDESGNTTNRSTTHWKRNMLSNFVAEEAAFAIQNSKFSRNTSSLPQSSYDVGQKLRAMSSQCMDDAMDVNRSDLVKLAINNKNIINLPTETIKSLSSSPPSSHAPLTQLPQHQHQVSMAFQNGYFRHTLPLSAATTVTQHLMPPSPPPPPPPSVAASSLLLASSSSSTLSLPLSSQYAPSLDLHASPKLQQPQVTTATPPPPPSPTTTATTTYLRQLENKAKNTQLFTVPGTEVDNEKLSPVGVIVSSGGYSDGNSESAGTGRLPHSSTGSLTSIITTSIASSEPDPGVSGGNAGTGKGNKLTKEKSRTGRFGRQLSNPNDDDDPRTPVVPNSTNIAGEPGNNDEKLALNRPGIKQEKWTSILFQVSIPFFLAGIGTIGAGIILGTVEKWQVFKSVAELFILVPALLGLKGNLDMCLASRMSTQVNMGNLTARKEIIRTIIGNIALVQVQATVASFLVAMFAVTIGAIKHGHFIFDQFMLLVAAAMFTATTSCFVLDFVLVAVILISQKFRLNPDNLATPLAASIGDVVSISLLSFIASLLYEHIKTHLWVTFLMVLCYLTLLPFWVVIVLKNKYARPIMSNGWVPVISALCISGFGGLVLDTAVEVFKGFVVFQPIINGIGGNLVSVHASKISTMLHQSSIIGIIPPHTKIFEWPWKALFKGVPYANTARLLICISIPGNILFICVADYIHMARSTITFTFVATYIVTSTLQVMLLLYIGHVIVHAMWKWKIDPDNSSIPYLTALGDLLGSSLLGLAFLFLLHINMEYGDGYYEAEGKSGAAATAAAISSLNISN